MPDSKSPEVTVHSLTKQQRRKLQKFSHHHEYLATVAILNMMATVAIAVRFPAYYWIWHHLRTSLYIPTRFVRFQKRGWELYLLDWCYFVSYISNICGVLAFLRVTLGWVSPLVVHNAALIRAGFAMACGPLAWSIYVFRNSIVFHDVDHTTSVFIHLSPFVFFWCLRWGAGQPSLVYEGFPEMFHVCSSKEEYRQADSCFESLQGMLWCEACESPVQSFLVPPLTVYLVVWAVPYFVMMFVIFRKWIADTGRETLYSYYVQCQPDLNATFEKILRPIAGEHHAGPLGYMLFHCLSMITLCATSWALWHSFLLHSLVFFLVLVTAVHNGSSYMFRVFAYRYASEQLEKYKSKIL